VLEYHCWEQGGFITIIFSCFCGHGLKIQAIETENIRTIWVSKTTIPVSIIIKIVKQFLLKSEGKHAKNRQK
jgi:hypothetical protein